MTKFDERISAVGEGFLWAVHVIGPDDVYPVSSYASAVAACAEHNEAFLDAMEKTGVAAIAVPSIWSGDEKLHAFFLKKGGAA